MSFEIAAFQVIVFPRKHQEPVDPEGLELLLENGYLYFPGGEDPRQAVQVIDEIHFSGSAEPGCIFLAPAMHYDLIGQVGAAYTDGSIFDPDPRDIWKLVEPKFQFEQTMSVSPEVDREFEAKYFYLVTLWKYAASEQEVYFELVGELEQEDLLKAYQNVLTRKGMRQDG